MTRTQRAPDGFSPSRSTRAARGANHQPQQHTPTVSGQFGPGLTILMVLLTGIGCSSPASGPTKYPVQGQILINDAPAERVAVTFHHADDTLPSNHRFATGVTDADGRFVLSTEGEEDGALAGSYRVTFAWMSSPDLDGYDMLSGAFADPSASSFIVEIPQSTPELAPFTLSIAEDRILRPDGASRSL